MTREDLLTTASALQQPPAAAAAEFESVAERIANELNRRMLARSDLDQLIGPGNASMMQNNSRNFTRFMTSVFVAYEPNVLVDTALWAFRTYRSHGFRVAYWPANLDTYVEILREELSPETLEAIYPFFHWLIVSIPAFAQLTDQEVEG
jgi:hypothetical protein